MPVAMIKQPSYTSPTWYLDRELLYKISFCEEKLYLHRRLLVLVMINFHTKSGQNIKAIKIISFLCFVRDSNNQIIRTINISSVKVD